MSGSLLRGQHLAGIDEGIRRVLVHRDGAAATRTLSRIDSRLGQRGVDLLHDGFHRWRQQPAREVIDAERQFLGSDRKADICQMVELQRNGVFLDVLKDDAGGAVEVHRLEDGGATDRDRVTLLAGEGVIEVAPHEASHDRRVVERCQSDACDGTGSDEFVWHSKPFMLVDTLVAVQRRRRSRAACPVGMKAYTNVQAHCLLLVLTEFSRSALRVDISCSDLPPPEPLPPSALPLTLRPEEEPEPFPSLAPATR